MSNLGLPIAQPSELPSGQLPSARYDLLDRRVFNAGIRIDSQSLPKLSIAYRSHGHRLEGELGTFHKGLHFINESEGNHALHPFFDPLVKYFSGQIRQREFNIVALKAIANTLA